MGRIDIHISMVDVYVSRLPKMCLHEFNSKPVEINGHTYFLFCGQDKNHGGKHEDVNGGVWWDAQNEREPSPSRLDLEDLRNVDFRPIKKKFGDHIPWAEFEQMMKGGGFFDSECHADLATATQCSNIVVQPSEIKEGFKPPSWATHVVFYDK